MEKVRILEVKQSVFASNDAQAEKLREELKQKGIYLLNLMSSPGSGKTTTLTRLIELLKEDLKIGVMEADIDSDVDAKTIAETGVRAIQLHTGGMCHLDAGMTHSETLMPLIDNCLKLCGMGCKDIDLYGVNAGPGSFTGLRIGIAAIKGLAFPDDTPCIGVSTPEAFAAYDTVGSSTHPDCEAQEKAIRAGDLDAVCAAAGNALEECSGAKDNEAIKALLRAHGAVTALMTGSGAAVFGIFESEEAARSAAEAVRAQWPQVYVARPDRGGARVISPKWML